MVMGNLQSIFMSYQHTSMLPLIGVMALLTHSYITDPNGKLNHVASIILVPFWVWHMLACYIWPGCFKLTARS